MLSSNQPMLIVWGPELTTLYNDGYAVLCGDRHPAALGRSFHALWHDAWNQVGPIVARCCVGVATRVDDAAFILHRHGYPEEARFALSYTPVHNEDGSVAGMFCAGAETTQHVAAERRLREERDRQEQRQKQQLMQMPGFIGLLRGPDHIYEYVNDAHIAIFGRRAFTGRAVRDVFPELEGQGFHEVLDQVYATGEPFQAQGIPVRLGDEAGSRFIDFRCQPIRDDDGTIVGLFAGGYDVTERVSAESALRHLTESLEQRIEQRTMERDQLWHASPDLISFSSPDGSFVAINPAWTATLGWEKADLLGRNFYDLIHPDDAEGAAGAARRCHAGQALDRWTSRCRHRDGSYRWINWSITPGDGIVNALGRDVTNERLQAEALAQTEAALRQSQKMEAVGQLTGGLAHDFNNLLTGISGSLELMQARVAQGRGNDVGRYVGAAMESAKRAAALTHRLLAFSRRQVLDPRPTNLNQLVAGMEDLVRRTVGPEITVETVAAAGLWSTLVDPSQLESALLNLCINARDAMPGGGTLVIETGNCWLDGQDAAERELPPGQYVTMCVADTGTGMTPDIIAKAFDPFFTTKPVGFGTGLGLSMVYGFVRQSYGQVRIYSEAGHGALVRLYLPRHFDEATMAEVLAVPSDVPRAGNNETVLVVDDEPTIRMLVVDILESLGYAALEAADGAEGLRVLSSDARIDLLVTDVGLPNGMNGRQVAESARAVRPDLKVLFVTGYTEDTLLDHGRLDAGMHVLTKPFAMETLARRVKELIGDR